MTRSSVSALVLATSLALAAPAAAQATPDDPMSPRAQLRALEHGAESVESGLAAVRRELRMLIPGGMDDIGASRLTLRLEDHFFGMTPISAMFSLDGQAIFHSSDVAEIERGAVYEGAVPSGPHVLSVELVYRGDVLYTTGMRAHIVSSHAVDTVLGRTTHVRVIAHDTSLLAAPPGRWTLDYAIETDPAR